MVILGQRLQTTAMARFRPRLKAKMIQKALNPSGLFIDRISYFSEGAIAILSI